MIAPVRRRCRLHLFFNTLEITEPYKFRHLLLIADFATLIAAYGVNPTDREKDGFQVLGRGGGWGGGHGSDAGMARPGAAQSKHGCRFCPPPSACTVQSCVAECWTLAGDIGVHWRILHNNAE